GAPHLPAARAQQIDDILLLRKRIEGCPWLPPGCDLTESQGNGEDLDEEGFHQEFKPLTPLASRSKSFAARRYAFEHGFSSCTPFFKFEWLWPQSIVTFAMTRMKWGGTSQALDDGSSVSLDRLVGVV